MMHPVEQPVRETERRNGPQRDGRRIVAICGTAGNSRDEILQAPAHWEMWGLSKSHWMPRRDVIFEMHERAHWPHVYTPEHVAWMAKQAVPIWTQRAYPDIPSSLRFPFQEVLQARYRPYFTSTIAYMLALAVFERVDEVRLLGVNMATDSEYGYQRGACEYWIGIAEASGIPVYLPEVCPMVKGLLYGRDNPMKDMPRKLQDWEDLLKRQLVTMQEEFVKKVAGELKDLETNTHGVHGALQLLEKMMVQAQGEQNPALLLELEAALPERMKEEART